MAFLPIHFSNNKWILTSLCLLTDNVQMVVVEVVALMVEVPYPTKHCNREADRSPPTKLSLSYK